MTGDNTGVATHTSSSNDVYAEETAIASPGYWMVQFEPLILAATGGGGTQAHSRALQGYASSARPEIPRGTSIATASFLGTPRRGTGFPSYYASIVALPDALD
ncbi:hypothetical protein BDP81DRAFT_423703 [Colletotrichum phormii]|uniref:Uncharacterized protein n=1 Tax=Colletotrichum phormii TaxID=359342 RepID=A0AAJ0EJN5_9PEZI|nr:uncharacterized protein BDP81DRAFT_423703 [Colletotrichum phormii]KAK1639221.1 hypothetical protein BDP81DRAFT_423703 [Colletotrichum phormii]